MSAEVLYDADYIRICAMTGDRINSCFIFFGYNFTNIVYINITYSFIECWL